MADTTALKNRIRAAIKDNNNQEITGPVLQQALLDVVDELNGATETEADTRQNGDSTLQQNITAEKNRAEGAESSLEGAINQEGVLRSNADATLQAAINLINSYIPAQASSSNKLADENFVNSSIATATATFRGTYNVVSDLSLSYNATHAQIQTKLAEKMSALSITPDNNDYAFVQIPTADATPTQIAKVEKYKYNGTAWAFEYELNNSGFTSAQWAAINSGATLELIGKLSALPTNAELTTLLNGKEAVANKVTTITSNSTDTQYASAKAIWTAITAWLSGAMSWTAAQMKQARANLGLGNGDIDNEPIAGSKNLVKSGGVTNYITQFADKYVTSDAQGRCANFDTTNGTLTFARDSWVILKPNNGMRYRLPSTPITYYTFNTSLIFLMYDYQLQTLIFRISDQTASNTELLLAVIRKNGYDIKEVNGCFNYTINNATVFQRFYDKYVLCNRNYANFDTENGTLTFPSDSWVMINCEDGKRYPLPTTPIEYNNSTLVSSVVFLIYNYTTQTLVFKISGQTVTNTEMLICVLKKDYQGTKIYEVSGCFNYTIDGVPFSGKQATYINTSINESIKNIQLYSTTLYSTRGVINKINVSKVATLSTSGGIQGCAIYGGVLFQAHDQGLISLFDINNDYQFISEYQSPLNVHMTNISFGNEKYDNNDEFPLLYVPQNGRTGYEVYVLRVSRQSSELVQTLSFPNNPNSIGYYPVSIVDSVNGYVYCWGYKRDNYSQEDNNEFIISKYLLPLLSEGNITLELIETFRVPYRGIGQGACCDGINLYFQCGIGQKPSYLQIISPFTKKEIGLLDCSEYHNSEPEGLTINANRLVSTYSDRSVYELSF